MRPGPLTTWTTACAILGGSLVLVWGPGALILFIPVWLLGVPPCYLLARRQVKKTKRKAQVVKPKSDRNEAAPPSKVQLATEAKKALDEARTMAALMDDPDQRGAFLAEQEAKFRSRMQELTG